MNASIRILPKTVKRNSERRSFDSVVSKKVNINMRGIFHENFRFTIIQETIDSKLIQLKLAIQLIQIKRDSILFRLF